MATNTPIIPEDINEWNLEVLESLLKVGGIESETFDFKGPDFHQLSTDMCAMANNPRGMIVLGISQEKKAGRVIGYQKDGFRQSQLDDIHNRIGNAKFDIEPMPEVTHIDLKEPYSSSDNTNKFYVILKIEGKDIEKPYFVKSKKLCYVRAGPTSTPADRTTIFNHYGNLKEKRNNVGRFRMCVNLLKESLVFTTEALATVDPYSITKIPPIDLSCIKNAMVFLEWFLIDYDLLGGHIDNNYIKSNGLYFHLQDLELLNLYISAYNSETDIDRKKELKTYIVDKQYWGPGRDKEKTLENFLVNIEKKTQNFLSKSN